MIEVLAMYASTLVAVILVAAALALVGSQIAARQSITESLVVSQSSAFGVALAVAIPPWLLLWFAGVPAGEVKDALTAVAESLKEPLVRYVIGFLLTAWVVRLGRFAMGSGPSSRSAASLRPEARNTVYIGLFVLLTALTYLMTAISPVLEGHIVAAFFGDPTFISPQEATGIAVLAVVVCIFMAWQWRQISSWSFEVATFGAPPLSPKLKRCQLIFSMASLLLLYSAVVLMGLLFTLACLLLPTILLAPACRHNRSFSRAIAPVAMVGAGGGFVFSLWEGSLPTTPCIALGLAASGLSFALLAGIIRFFQRPIIAIDAD